MKRITILVFLSACTPELTTPAPAPSAPGDGLAPAAAPAPEVGAAVVETPAADPTPQPMGLAEPPTLKMSLFGECKNPGIDIVDDEVFVHHREYVHRMGPDGTPAQTLPFGLRFPASDSYRPLPTSFRQVGGRWPDQFYAVADYSHRDFDGVKLARWQDGKWTFANVFGRAWDYTAVWPWQNASILTLASTWTDAGNSGPRFGIVRGAGKGPITKGAMRKAECEGYEFEVVHVSPTGPVTAIISCTNTLLARWEPDDREGTSVRLNDGPGGNIEMALDQRGDGYIALEAKPDILFRWKDGTLSEQPLPKLGHVTALALSPAGEPWMVAGGTLHRHEDGTWQQEELPGDAAVTSLAGVSVSAPWAIRNDKTLWARLADGTWTAIDIPPVGPKRTDPIPVSVTVRKPGDAWLIAKYRKLWRGKKTMRQVRAIYTERPVDTPHECGPITWDE